MNTPVNSRSLKQHFTYSWWKYLLVLLAGYFLVDLLFTVTTPRVPEEKKVDFYVYGYADIEKLSAYMENVRKEKMPAMEQMQAVQMVPDDTYGQMQLVTYLSAGEGDLYLLPREQFLSLSSDGTFYPLETDQELMDFFTSIGADLKRGWRTDNEGETHLQGISASFLPGLSSYCVAEDGFLCVIPHGGNVDNTLLFLQILSSDMASSPEPADQTQD